jgi:Arc/MetJ family transcription regulator
MAMLTHIDIDEKLLGELFALKEFPSKRLAVNTALAEYIRVLRRRALMELRGKMSWEADLEALRAPRDR